MSHDAEIKAGMRKFLAEQGRMVKFEERYGFKHVSTYGWSDYENSDHMRRCSWVIPEGTVVKEETYSQCLGTFTSNRDEVGLNAEGVSCACGKYKDVTIRVTSTLGEAIRSILGYDPSTSLEL